ncbi:MAG: divergent polysaccharide deacetylase family protein [Rhodospirillaceae bacterium]
MRRRRLRRLGRSLPGALLVVAAGIAVGLLLGLGAGRVPPPVPPAAPHHAGGEEPGHPAPPPAVVLPQEPGHAQVPSLDLANLPPALAVGPVLAPPGGGEDSTVLAAALTPPRPPGQPAWLRHAVPFVLPAAAPMIALVFDDLGLDRVHTARVIRLPGPLTLSFLPYAADLPHQTAAAHTAGHELLVHMPMEPLGAGLDPGPGALLTRLPPDEILRRLDRGLAAFTGYVGLNNHMGSRFTSDRALMTPVLADLKRRGLLFLDSVTAGSSVGAEVAASLHLPHSHRNVFLDDELTAAAVHANLVRLEEIARRTGAAVAIGHPHAVTLDAVTPWLAGLTARDFVLAPLSAVVRSRGYGQTEPGPAPSDEPRKGPR